MDDTLDRLLDLVSAACGGDTDAARSVITGQPAPGTPVAGTTIRTGRPANPVCWTWADHADAGTPHASVAEAVDAAATAAIMASPEANIVGWSGDTAGVDVIVPPGPSLPCGAILLVMWDWRRPDEIRVRATYPAGDEITLHGYAARVPATKHHPRFAWRARQIAALAEVTP